MHAWTLNHHYYTRCRTRWADMNILRFIQKDDEKYETFAHNISLFFSLLTPAPLRFSSIGEALSFFFFFFFFFFYEFCKNLHFRVETIWCEDGSFHASLNLVSHCTQTSVSQKNLLERPSWVFISRNSTSRTAGGCVLTPVRFVLLFAISDSKPRFYPWRNWIYEQKTREVISLKKLAVNNGSANMPSTRRQQ